MRASMTPRESQFSDCLRPIWVCTKQRLVAILRRRCPRVSLFLESGFLG